VRAEPPRYYRLIRGQDGAVDTSGGRDCVLPYLQRGVGERGLTVGVRVYELALRIGAVNGEQHRCPRGHGPVMDCCVESLRGSLQRIRRHRGWREHQRRSPERGGSIATTAAGVGHPKYRRALRRVEASVGAEGHEVGARGGRERGATCRRTRRQVKTVDTSSGPIEERILDEKRRIAIGLCTAGQQTQVVELEPGQVTDGRRSGNIGAAYLGDLGVVPDIDSAARSERQRRVRCRGQGCVYRRGRRTCRTLDAPDRSVVRAAAGAGIIGKEIAA
jgi:hypothetical protein